MMNTPKANRPIAKRRSETTTPTKKILITGDMLIGDILNGLPDSAEIMQDFGLHCTSCSVNVFEPLKMGAMSHGIEEEVVDEMIEKINDLALARRRAPDDGIYMTDFAASKVKEFAKTEGKEGYALKITAHATPQRSGGHARSVSEVRLQKEPTYAMDFQEKVGADEKSFEFHGVTIHLDPESLKNLAGAEVDFVETAYGSGFKITNPNFTNSVSGHSSETSDKKSGCGCGSGSCSSGGTCGCSSGGNCE